MPQGNNKRQRGTNRDIDGGPIEGRLNSDNAFSDQGLNNAESTRKAAKKEDR